MNITKINGFKPIHFRENNEKKSDYENPISRSTERNLAILGSVGGAAVTGGIIGGLTSFLLQSSKNKTKFSVLTGAAAMLLYLAVSLPPKLYNTKVGAFLKEKEMDVFSRDRALKSNLTEEVNQEVKDPEVSLDKKLDDNLKLQMANKGGVLGIANVTPQS